MAICRYSHAQKRWAYVGPGQGRLLLEESALAVGWTSPRAPLEAVSSRETGGFAAESFSSCWCDKPVSAAIPRASAPEVDAIFRNKCLN